jgi:RHS repeat-associated protein
VSTIDDTLLHEYLYDALGRRILTHDHTPATAVQTRHVYGAGFEVLAEYESSDNWETEDLAREFLWGERFPEPLVLIDWTTGPEKAYHYLHDHLGSVIALVDAGDPEAKPEPIPPRVVERYTYDPYGTTYIETWNGSGYDEVEASAYGNPFAWTAQRYDAGVGLYAFPFRGYSPALARFLQRDPLGYIDGPNLYEYARSMPTVLTDPLGLTSILNPAVFGGGNSRTTTGGSGATGGGEPGLGKPDPCVRPGQHDPAGDGLPGPTDRIQRFLKMLARVMDAPTGSYSGDLGNSLEEWQKQALIENAIAWLRRQLGNAAVDKWLDATKQAQQNAEKLLKVLKDGWGKIEDLRDIIKETTGKDIPLEELQKLIDDGKVTGLLNDLIRGFDLIGQSLDALKILRVMLDGGNADAGDIARALSQLLRFGASIGGGKFPGLGALGDFNPFAAWLNFYADAVLALAGALDKCEWKVAEQNVEGIEEGNQPVNDRGLFGRKWLIGPAQQ